MRFPSTSIELIIKCLPKSPRSKLRANSTSYAVRFSDFANERDDEVREENESQPPVSVFEEPSAPPSRRKQLLTATSSRQGSLHQSKEFNQRSIQLGTPLNQE